MPFQKLFISPAVYGWEQKGKIGQEGIHALPEAIYRTLGGMDNMAANKAQEKLIESLAAIRSLAKESEALLKAKSPDVERLLATLQAQAGLQQALLEKLLEVINPSDVEQDLNDTFQQAVQELLEYFQERVRLRGKVADAAALKHLRRE